MTTADPETRIADLKARWEADPSSRIFVQLADEHRRAGNTGEAIEVLKKGLAGQPNYVTAQAALGRCYLAAGDIGSAIEVLSRVMEQDPSHPLAGKLLVEAHLQTGELDEANKRLEHYRMVADSGPEVEDLEERLASARREQSAVAPAASPATTAGSTAATSAEPTSPSAASEDVFDFGSVELSIPDSEPNSAPFEPAPAAVSVPEPDPFDLPSSPERPVSLAIPASSEDPFQLDPVPRAPVASPGSSAQDEPFGDLFAGSDPETWSQDPDRDEIFQLGGRAEEAGISPADAAEPVLQSTEPESFVFDDFAPEDAEVEDTDLDDADEEAESEEATVTLGQLYMAQGHRQEAARIFRSVLEKDPQNEISLRALAQLEGGGAPKPPPEPQAEEEPALSIPESSMGSSELPSPELPEAPQDGMLQAEIPQEEIPQEEIPQEEAPPVAAAPLAAKGITERKISALEDYLHRLRRAAQS